MTAVQYAILTHNRPESLTRLLHSIAAQATPREHAITIFDNGSDQPQAATIRQLAERFRATVIRSGTNLRMAGRRALEDHLFGVADADVLVHLDDDVTLGEGWLAATLRCLNGASYAACGSIEDHDGDQMISGQRTIDIRPHLTGAGPVRLWRWAWQAPESGEQVVPVEFAGHRALAVRMEVARGVRHDPGLAAGGDDIAYSLALRCRGHRLAVSTDATIRHRSAREPDLPGFRAPSAVIESWRTFHRTWGFVRDTAAAEARMTLDEFLHAVTDRRPDEPRRPASRSSTEAHR